MEEVIKLFLVACRGQTQAQQVEVLEREKFQCNTQWNFLANGPGMTWVYFRGQYLPNHWSSYSSCHIGAAAR